MTLAFQIFSSPLGEILVAGKAYAVTHVTLGEDKHQLSAYFRMEHSDASPVDASGYIREACGLISDYLHGRSDRIDVAVQADGTEFERKVWHAIRQIPYGKTTTYSAIATSIGTPHAFRAVANACGKNPVPLIIPCHRVIHKNGDRSGFGLGEKAKHYLLDLEKTRVGISAEHVAQDPA